jgi:hypothetical protein
MSLGEIMMKPTAMLYRNLLSIETQELLRSNPIDGAVLLGGCDKTAPVDTHPLSNVHGACRMPDDMEDFRALDPFFRIIEQGLVGLVDGDHFFDLLAEDVVFDFVITVPDYPRQVVGRDNLIELYRGYGSTFFLDSCYDGQQTANTPQWTRRHLMARPNDGTR